MLFLNAVIHTMAGPVLPNGYLRIEGTKIMDVGPMPVEPDEEFVDLGGAHVYPGFIDAHTHFDLDVCNTTTADDFYSGSRSALRGGTTTVIENLRR